MISSTIARMNGSHDAAAMIIGCGTDDTTMKPLSWKVIPAINPPSLRIPNTRANRYAKTPASPSCSQANTP